MLIALKESINTIKSTQELESLLSENIKKFRLQKGLRQEALSRQASLIALQIKCRELIVLDLPLWSSASDFFKGNFGRPFLVWR